MLRSALAPAAKAVTASTDSASATGSSAPSAVVLMLVRYRRHGLAWGLSRLVTGARDLGTAPGLRFAHVLGTGRDGGFGLVPGFERQGLIAFFDDLPCARTFVATSPALRERRERADECLTALLGVAASRGTWAGVPLSPVASIVDGQPIASLTRAAIRPRHARAFWGHSPGSEASLAQAPGCHLAVGLGEAPLLRQATFSLWRNAAAMNAYAHQGAHLAASRAAWQHGWFSESMFVRFAPLSIQGSWRGRTYG